FFFFSSRRRHTRCLSDWSSDVCSSDLVTLSAGISDITHAVSAEQLFRFADGALYWSKAKGRDCTWIYDPHVVRELSAQERAEHRSEERRVGKEWRSRWGREHEKEKIEV